MICVGVTQLVARRRPPGTPLTWGEAIAAGGFVFATMLLGYAIVPNQWLAWADNQLKWRADAIGIPTPRATIFKHGTTFFGRGKVTVNDQPLRDSIVTVISVVVL